MNTERPEDSGNAEVPKASEEHAAEDRTPEPPEANGASEATEASEPIEEPIEASERSGAPGIAGDRAAGPPEVSRAPDPAEVPDGPAHPHGSDSEDGPNDPDGPGGPGGRRRSSGAVALVAAAAVLLVGGGGAYLAATNGTGGRTGGGLAASGATTPPPLTLDGWAADGTGGIAPGEPDPYGARYVTQGELPDGPGSAPVYEPGAEVGREQVARLAQALGVTGTPVAEGRTWRAGGQDGTGPSLQVNRDAPGSWTFSRYAPGTDNCRKVTVCAQDPGAPAGEPVSVAAAEKAAAPVLKAAGLDDAKIDASQVMGAQRVVNADPVIGGLPTYGWTTGLTVDRKGVLVGGHGLLATPVKGDTYPVVGAEKALELMNGATKRDHRMGIGGCASPVPLKDRLEQPCGASTGAPGRDGNTVTVEKAVFGLAAQSVGGRQTLVPSWLFRARGSLADDSFTVTYPAVDPEYLASASSPSSPPPSLPPASSLPSSPSAPSSSPSAPETPGAPRKSRSVKVNAYTAADGRTLLVSFYGGVCADYRTSAQESDGRVTVRVTETPWPGKVCVLIAQEYVKTVRLDAPLDGRTVVGTDGKEIRRAKPGSLKPDSSAQPR